MMIQYYDDEDDIGAQIFDSEDEQMLAELRTGRSRDEVDHDLSRLGLRRREAWQRREWGWEAKLRK